MQKIANAGGLVIAAYEPKEGRAHTATVRPEGVAGDEPPAHGRGPLINDIGRSVRVQNENWAFPKGAEIHYYTPRQP